MSTEPPARRKKQQTIFRAKHAFQEKLRNTEIEHAAGIILRTPIRTPPPPLRKHLLVEIHISYLNTTIQQKYDFKLPITINILKFVNFGLIIQSDIRIT